MAYLDLHLGVPRKNLVLRCRCPFHCIRRGDQDHTVKFSNAKQTQHRAFLFGPRHTRSGEGIVEAGECEEHSLTASTVRGVLSSSYVFCRGPHAGIVTGVVAL